MPKYEYFASDPQYPRLNRGAGYYHYRGRGEYSKQEGMSRAARHPNVLGAGAAVRVNLAPEEKRRLVLHEFKEGTLHSSSGGVVKDRQQAVAIALSEERKQKVRRGDYW